jgi:threonyl-tRNA synthetase
MGSLERFFGVLLEHTGGDFPLWLAPVQMRLLPVSDNAIPFCDEVAALAHAIGVRMEVDNSQQRLAKKIRIAEREKIPLMAVVGEIEEHTRTLAVRARKGGDLGSYDIDDLFTKITAAVATGVDKHV